MQTSVNRDQCLFQCRDPRATGEIKVSKECKEYKGHKGSLENPVPTVHLGQWVLVERKGRKATQVLRDHKERRDQQGRRRTRTTGSCWQRRNDDNDYRNDATADNYDNETRQQSGRSAAMRTQLQEEDRLDALFNKVDTLLDRVEVVAEQLIAKLEATEDKHDE